MRLGWVIYGNLGQKTGGYIYDRLVIEGLRARGDDVIVSGEWLPEPAEGIDESGPLAEWLLNSRVDAVVGDALWAGQLGPAFERLAGKGVARILLVHHLTSWEVECAARDTLRFQEARALAASDGWVATGSATAGRIRAEYGNVDVDVVPPGADRLPRYPRAMRADRNVDLLFVGNLVERKNLPLLLDVMEGLADPRLSLMLLGDPAREPDHARGLAARVAQSPVLRPRVAMVGLVDDETLARRMAWAQGLVLPSSVEGYGMALTEALWAGLPSIASRQAARASGLEKSDATVVFDDASGLVEALGRFAENATFRQAMQRAAEAAVVPRWRQTVDAFRETVLRVSRQVQGPCTRGNSQGDGEDGR